MEKAKLNLIGSSVPGADVTHIALS